MNQYTIAAQQGTIALTNEFSTSSFTAVAKSVMTWPEQILATETLSIALMLGPSMFTAFQTNATLKLRLGGYAYCKSKAVKVEILRCAHG